MGHVAAQDAVCEGGPTAACECILQCPVFGGTSEECRAGQTDDTNAVVNRHVTAAMKEVGNECAGIECIVKCSKRLGCLRDSIQGKCLNVKAQVDDCHVDCSNANARDKVSVQRMALLAAVV